MNILFLDIDGVLNRCDGSGLNTDKVALLKEISDATDCRIVLSSSWRLNERQMGRVLTMLRDNGIRWIDNTPDKSKETGAVWTTVLRLLEIDAWIYRNEKFIPAWYSADEGVTPNRFVILDDEADMGPLSHLHVRTDSHTGLTPELAREIISRFNDNPTIS